MNGHVWKARVRVPAHGPASGRTSTHRFQSSSALGLGLNGEHPSTLDSFLNAVCSELLLQFRASLNRKALDFEYLEIQVRARLGNPLLALGVVGEKGHAGLESFEGVCHLTSLFDVECKPEAELAWREALSRCVILNSLNHNLDLNLRLNIL